MNNVFDKRLLVEKIMVRKNPLSQDFIFSNKVKVLAVGLDFPQNESRKIEIDDILLVTGIQEFEGINETYVMPSQILRWDDSKS